MIMIDLFGNEISSKPLIRDLFIEPPFSVLDSKSGSWVKRKSMWKKLNIKSEVSRKAVINLKNWSEAYQNANTGVNYGLGTSIFDPVLCEVLYHWFCEKGCKILDPFAGGSVRGIVANYLGYNYTGVEIREEQVIANREQALDILHLNNQPQWYLGDSCNVLDGFIKDFDFVFSCPPYGDLETYSDLDGDISNMEYSDFLKYYEIIIKKSCDLLKDDGFACFVVGNIRDKKGNYRNFVNETIQFFIKSGMVLYNDAVYLENGLNTAAMRSKKYMRNLKLVKVHQNILIFKKRGEKIIKTKFRPKPSS